MHEELTGLFLTWINYPGSRASSYETTSGKQGSKPLVYSCSGCSNVAQLANRVALRNDRCGLGEMSCIAGIGVTTLPSCAGSAAERPILALHGYHLHNERKRVALERMRREVETTDRKLLSLMAKWADQVRAIWAWKRERGPRE